MELLKTTFNKLKIGDECIFMNSYGHIVHCNKIGKDLVKEILDDRDEHYVSAYHEVYKILNGKYEFKPNKTSLSE